MHDTKEHILQTAFMLFMQKSYKAVTMKEIVGKTDLSKGAFYHYFSSKEQVFEEVVNQHFMKLMDISFEKFNRDSLKAFYQDILQGHEDHMKMLCELQVEDEAETHLNFFAFIFEALKILPDFKQKIIRHHEMELEVWTEVIAHAKEQGEIESTLSDKDIAKLFIYAADGAGLQRIIMRDDNRSTKEMELIYDGLYELLKAK